MSTRMRSARTACALLILLSLSGAVALFAADRPAAPVIVEEIVAKINGDIVTRGDLAKAHAEAEQALKAQGLAGEALDQQLQLESKDELRNQIDRLLLVQKAKELDINVDADLTKQIADIQSQSKIADPDKFHEYVQQQTGMSFEDFKLLRKNALLTDRVIGEQVWRTIVIPDADVQKYYNEHKADFVRRESVTLREILVSTGDGKPETVAAARKKADVLLARARGGTDKFSDLARQYSDDASATDDGLLPTAFERGAGADPTKQLNKAIEDVVFSHERGYVTDVIQIRGVGFAIYRVEEHIPAGQATLDDVRAQITNILTKPIADPKLRDYLTMLRQNAFLQIKPGYVDSGAAPGKDTAWKDPTQLMPETTTKEAVANQRHFKKFLGFIPYGYTGQKEAAAAPLKTPVPQSPADNADGSPRQ